MLLELAAFNAGFATVKATISAGRDIASAAAAIGKMVDNKDAMQQRLSKKKNSVFNARMESDLEEFMALEKMKEAEAELKQMMIYMGRPGLHGDFIKFCSDARKRRKEAERQAQKEREEMLENIATAGGIFLGVILCVGALAGFIYWYKG